MKILFIVWFVVSLIAIAKTYMIVYDLKRDYIIKKVERTPLEMVVRFVYGVFLICVPPFNVGIAIVPEKAIKERLSNGLVKKDA